MAILLKATLTDAWVETAPDWAVDWTPPTYIWSDGPLWAKASAGMMQLRLRSLPLVATSAEVVVWIQGWRRVRGWVWANWPSGATDSDVISGPYIRVNYRPAGGSFVTGTMHSLGPSVAANMIVTVETDGTVTVESGGATLLTTSVPVGAVPVTSYHIELDRVGATNAWMVDVHELIGPTIYHAERTVAGAFAWVLASDVGAVGPVAYTYNTSGPWAGGLPPGFGMSDPDGYARHYTYTYPDGSGDPFTVYDDTTTGTGYATVATAGLVAGIGGNVAIQRLTRYQCVARGTPAAPHSYIRRSFEEAWSDAGAIGGAGSGVPMVAGHKAILAPSLDRVSAIRGEAWAAGDAGDLGSGEAGPGSLLGATDTLTDAVYMPQTHRVWGSGKGAAGNILAFGLTRQVLAASDPTAWPLVTQRSDGRVEIGVFAAETFTSWVSAGDDTWTADRSDALTGSSLWFAAWACGLDRRQVACGCDLDAMVAFVRPACGEPWLGPFSIAALDAPLAPYCCRLPNGLWEVGWYTGTGWVLYRAADPAGTWSVVP